MRAKAWSQNQVVLSPEDRATQKWSGRAAPVTRLTDRRRRHNPLGREAILTSQGRIRGVIRQLHVQPCVCSSCVQRSVSSLWLLGISKSPSIACFLGGIQQSATERVFPANSVPQSCKYTASTRSEAPVYAESATSSRSGVSQDPSFKIQHWLRGGVRKHRTFSEWLAEALLECMSFRSPLLRLRCSRPS